MHRPWIPKYVSWGLWSQLLVPDHDQPHGTLLNTSHFGGQSLFEITLAFLNDFFFEKVEKTGIISTKFSLRCTPSVILGFYPKYQELFLSKYQTEAWFVKNKPIL